MGQIEQHVPDPALPGQRDQQQDEKQNYERGQNDTLDCRFRSCQGSEFPTFFGKLVVRQIEIDGFGRARLLPSRSVYISPW